MESNVINERNELYRIVKGVFEGAPELVQLMLSRSIDDPEYMTFEDTGQSMNERISCSDTIHEE